jgi:tripartite-type tricarboxylate transporter receptor subunit TctC
MSSLKQYCGLFAVDKHKLLRGLRGQRRIHGTKHRTSKPQAVQGKSRAHTTVQATIPTARKARTWAAKVTLRNILAAVAIVLTNGLSAADPIEGSYKGQSITLTIGSEPGGGYDQYARTLAQHIGRFIPGNPNVIPKNVPGADGIQAAHRLYKLAPSDGTEIGSFHRGIPILPLIGQMKQIEFDATKLGWIGSLNKEASLCGSWHTSRIRTFEDMLEREFIVGVTAAGASLDTFEAPLMNLFGAKLKVVAGYRGGQNIDLAMERGEIDGRCGVSWSSLIVRAADWFKEGKINILLQFGLNRHPDLKDVRMMQDIATKAEDKQALELLQIPTLIGRPFLAPSGRAGRAIGCAPLCIQRHDQG